MTTKHFKINYKTRYKPRKDYQKDRQRRRKIKLLIGTTIFLLVYGVFLKGTLATEDGSTKDDLEQKSNKSNDVLTANETGYTVDEAGDTVDETAIDKVPSAVNTQNNNTEGESEVEENVPYRLDRPGQGTEHEVVGIEHFRPITFTPFVPKLNYTNPKPKRNYGMNPVFKMTNFLLDIMTPDNIFPEGYVEIREDNNFYLGRRAHNNEWLPLVGRMWLVWLIVIFFLILIIAIPFIAVCYFGFCCHKRCGRHCPPCDEIIDKQLRCYYGIALLVLLIGLLFGIITAFASNRLLEHGFAQSTRNIGRSSEDTCTFLTNTNNHLKHLYINNYQEMVTQLSDTLLNADLHISLDLIDVSKAKALSDLISIFEKMPDALKLMTDLEKLVNEARFYASQLRDALRGAKRELSYYRAMFCYHKICTGLYENISVYKMDRGCLHYDKVPNTTMYVEAIKDIIDQDLIQIPYNGLEKLKVIANSIKELHDVVTPGLLKTLNRGSAVMSNQAKVLSSLVDKIIRNIHLKTMRTTHSFDDIYAKLGKYRNLTNVILCSVLLAILMCLIIALGCGSFAKHRRGYRDDSCNKGTGAICLLIAMLLIFITFSITALIGLFYFIFGLLAYHGACAPLRDTTTNNIFNSFDSLIDLNTISPPVKTGYGYINDDNTENPLPPMRLSTALNSCRSNESIIDLLNLNDFYSIRNLELLKIVKKLKGEADHIPILPNTLKNLELVSMEDLAKINKVRESDLSTYNSYIYKRDICRPELHIHHVIEYIKIMLAFIPSYTDEKTPYNNVKIRLQKYEQILHRELTGLVLKIHAKVAEIDQKLLRNHVDFNETLLSILNDIMGAQEFIRKRGVRFINELTAIMNRHIVREVGIYKEYIINETNFNVGRCKPLAYVYQNGVDIVCNQMVDPMNGFWLGVLLCCLLFLPILWVAHKLQCLYNKVGYNPPRLASGSCPECTGEHGPIKPATVIVCSEGLGNEQCPFPLLRENVSNVYGDNLCLSQVTVAPHSPEYKSNENNENGDKISEWGNIFDVEAQQKIVYLRSSQAFQKRKID